MATNRAIFLTVLIGSMTNPTAQDRTNFTIKYNTQPIIGRNRKTPGVMLVNVFQPGIMAEKT
jgi:hypothetical protein